MLMSVFGDIDFAWMAWTWPTAIFFAVIAGLLLIMTLLAIFRPEVERVGILRVPTTRGDRLFISLLGSAFISLFCIGISIALGIKDPNLWWGLGLSLIYAAAVFRFV
jgi:predicted small integral membrane protein